MHRLKPRATCALLLALATLVVAAPVRAQRAPGTIFVAGVAYERGGPGPSLVHQLALAGMDDEAPVTCMQDYCPGIPHPYHVDEGLALAVRLGAGYRFPGPFAFEAVVVNGPRGHAKGYSRERREQLLVSYATWMLAGTLRATLGSVGLEAGPTLNTAGWEVSRNSSRAVQGRTWTLGGMAAASVSITVRDVALSLRGGVRGFRPADLSERVNVALRPDYGTVFLGISTATLLD